MPWCPCPNHTGCFSSIFRRFRYLKIFFFSWRMACTGSKKFIEFKKMSMSLHDKNMKEELINEGCLVPNCLHRKFVTTSENLEVNPTNSNNGSLRNSYIQYTIFFDLSWTKKQSHYLFKIFHYFRGWFLLWQFEYILRYLNLKNWGTMVPLPSLLTGRPQSWSLRMIHE